MVVVAAAVDEEEKEGVGDRGWLDPFFATSSCCLPTGGQWAGTTLPLYHKLTVFITGAILEAREPA